MPALCASSGDQQEAEESAADEDQREGPEEETDRKWGTGRNVPTQSHARQALRRRPAGTGQYTLLWLVDLLIDWLNTLLVRNVNST